MVSSAQRKTPEHYLSANLTSVVRQLEWCALEGAPGKRSVWDAWAKHMQEDLKSIKLLTMASDEEVQAEVEHREAAGR